VPEHVRARFVQVGRKFYFPDGARAFTDRGGRLTTPSENTEVIRSLVAIAQARGWGDVTVSGSERFRREAWFEAKLSGLDVRGYRASPFEQERLARAAARAMIPEQAPAPSNAEPQAPRNGRDAAGKLIRGRLVDHGRATYRHDSAEPPSYFAKIETERGERTLWGIDLERAFKESLTQPKIGDAVGLRALRKDVVTVKAPARDANGQVVGEQELKTHRNRWIVEREEFFEARAAVADTVRNTAVEARAAVREHPELAGTYLYLKAAEEVAKRRIRDPQDQRRFVETVRGALADSVARGDPLAAVRLRSRDAERKHEREHAATRA
jgi:putative DNA primase/helicase